MESDNVSGAYLRVKPWRPYWKRLELLSVVLVRNIDTPPFDYWSGAYDWIAQRRFADIGDCDVVCNNLAQFDLPSGELMEFYQVIEGKAHRWELVLRCECAIDFCRGIILYRKIFDWAQPPAQIYKWLLVDLWRGNALHWAYKTYRNNPHREELARKFQGAKPLNN